MGFHLGPVGRDQDQVATDPSLRVRRASLDDVDEVLDLLAEAAVWMHARGYENWPERFPRALIAGNAERGELYLAEQAGVTVATLALQWSDEFFWGEAGADGAAG